MKKTLLLTALLLALTATLALAGGVNFAWGTNCYSDNPVSLKTFACNANTATISFMSMSFMIDTEMADMVGIEITAEGISDQATLPDWWKVGATDCRPNAMTYNGDSSVNASAACADWNGGAGFGVFGYTFDTNRGHISAGYAIPADVPFVMAGGQEYYGGAFALKGLKTVGTGLCAGCTYGMKWGLTLITVAGLDGRRDNLDTAIGNQCLSWQAAGANMPCDRPVPAKNTTWGQVKSLYR